MDALNFDSGLKTYTVNGSTTISFNPADGHFVESLYRMLENIKEATSLTDERELELKGDSEEAFRFAHERDKRIRAEIDNVFGPVSSALFPGMDCTALAGGVPVWLNFVLAVLDVIDAEVSEQVGKPSPKLDAYLAKYRKYQR